MKQKNALTALAAVALPLYQGAQAASMPESEIALRHSQYQEENAPQERTLSSVTERYSIQVEQLHYGQQVNDDWYVSTDLQYETMSGASPMQTYQNSAGQSVLVMSGASIEDKRTDVSIRPQRYFSTGVAAAMLAYSTEDDYQSIAYGLDGSLELPNQSTTLIGSISLSNDTLSPTDADISPARQEADGASKRSLSIYEGVSQIINRSSVIQVGIGYTKLSGYLSDPYKFEDRRPDERNQLILDSNYRLYFPVLNAAALHLDYRYYTDDWGIRAHTLTGRWAQEVTLLSLNTLITPSVRYYRQTQADFYRLEQNPPDNELSSSDSRLASYGAITLGMEAQVSWQQWEFSFDLQRYYSSTDLALTQKSETETPGLVNFQVFSLGLGYEF